MLHPGHPRRCRGTLLLATVLVASGGRLPAHAREPAAPAAAGTWRLENAHVGRVVTVADGPLRTLAILNKRAGTEAVPVSCAEFALRFARGIDRPETAATLTAADFTVVRTSQVAASAAEPTSVLAVLLESAAHGLTVEVRYTLGADDCYLRKQLLITAARPVTLERIDVDVLELDDAHQPYAIRAINARGKWSPGLGQPLHGTRSATFWGVEFPAADNSVHGRTLRCGYLPGRTLDAGVTYHAYPAVVGVADDPARIGDAFLDYIDRIRVRPFRLQVQYNSWFDHGAGVNQETFARSVAQIHRALVVERGTRPLQAYVVDDGWQDTAADWSRAPWQVNGKFAPDFAPTHAAVRAASARLGLWLSPGCLFGAQGAVPRLRAAGCEALGKWMSLAGPKYMQLLEDRMLELARQGVGFFKLDGLFGHLHTREFELHGARYGLAERPWLGAAGLAADDARLDDPKFDELKISYLSAGTERLMRLFARLAEVDPEIYLVISNGAYLSPWWLMHVDAVWMINADDAAAGSTRTQELVYRDDRYHEIWRQERTPFPLNAVFNHEPKKLDGREAPAAFRDYLFMSLSRGTGFVELYVVPRALRDHDWDVLAAGLHWTDALAPAFRHARMHGGSPRAGAVYGYSGWTRTQGYVSIHNPADRPQRYAVTLDRELGLPPGSGPFRLSSPIAEGTRGLGPEYACGDTLELDLAPREVRILCFDAEGRDWRVVRDLLARSPAAAAAPAPAPAGAHAVLGTWEYRHEGRDYTRAFTADGLCVLRQGDDEVWRKPFDVESDTTVVVEGGLRHVLDDERALSIEGRYRATRR